MKISSRGALSITVICSSCLVSVLSKPSMQKKTKSEDDNYQPTIWELTLLSQSLVSISIRCILKLS